LALAGRVNAKGAIMPARFAFATALALLPVAATAQLYRPMPGQPAAVVSGLPEGATPNRFGNFTLNGALRTRFDALDGQYRSTGPVGDSMLSTRLLVFGEYDAGPVQLGFELADSRGYPRQPNSTIGTGEINALELVQINATAELGELLGEGSNSELTVGRMVMDVGSRRLIGRPQFRNTVNGLTGVRLDRRDGSGNQLLLLWAMPQIRLPRDQSRIRDNAVVWDRETTDQQIMLASHAWALPHNGVVQLYGYGLIERDAPGFATSDRRLFTPGIRWFQPPRPGAFDHDIEAVAQMGTVSTSSAATAPRVRQRGWFIHATAGYTLPGKVNLRPALVIDAASGDRFNATGTDTGATVTRFDTLIGARRWEWGPSSLYGPLNRNNIISPSLRLEANTGPWFDAFIA
jgi:hypothetical protein